MPRKVALRDAALLALTLAAWALDARLAGGGGVAVAAALAAGVLTAVSGFLVHEWGHLIGAHLGGSTVHVPDRLTGIFLFQYDSDRNDRRRFLWMSCGGFAASALVLAALLAWLPLGALSGRVALALVTIGLVATFVTELPVAWRVARGAPLPRGGPAYVSSSSG